MSDTKNPSMDTAPDSPNSGNDCIEEYLQKLSLDQKETDSSPCAENIRRPPVFSMDALTDVLGVLIGDDEGEEGPKANSSEQQKFCLDDISTIESNANSVANALFNANQTANIPGSNSEAQTQLNQSTSRDLLPQMNHPLFDTLLSPATSSRCTSPVYAIVQEDLSKTNRRDGNYASGDSHHGSECSDSDFELDGDSSPDSDDSSDSDFNMDDSGSEYGKRRKRARKMKKDANNKVFTLFGARRKQPYYLNPGKSGEGEDKPSAPRQISNQQLEAIASTMGSSPITVTWLLQNYETSDGNSLPRALMYGHYLRHCAELRLDPVNAASFGKLIRSVFVGLTTRRLGTRGNSKYHYCGIRIKDSSTLLLEDPDLSKKTRTNGKRSKKNDIKDMQGVGICGLGGNKGLTLELDSGGNVDYKSVKKYIGTRTSVFPEISVSEMYVLNGVTAQDLACFIGIYEQHCLEILDAAEKFKLEEFEVIWNRFYQCGPGSSTANNKETMLKLTQNPEVQFSVENIDAYVYDQLLSIFMPNVVAQLPFQLLEVYHKFMFNLRVWLGHSVTSYDSTFVQQKLTLLDAFLNEFKAWISLNLSAQSARDSMQSPNSIAQLLSDLNRINFRSVLMDVKEYVSVDEMDINVHESLKRILSGPDSIEPWSIWLVGLVEQRLGKSRNINDAEDGDSTYIAIIQECRDLSLRWLKYMSQLKLELLLRSSGSLATFLSLELLFSNFLLHLIKVYKSRALSIPLVMYNMSRKASGNPVNDSQELRHPLEEADVNNQQLQNQGSTFPSPIQPEKTSEDTFVSPQQLGAVSIKQEIFDEQELEEVKKSS